VVVVNQNGGPPGPIRQSFHPRQPRPRNSLYTVKGLSRRDRPSADTKQSTNFESNVKR